jgi:predicted transcriptional regulator
MRKAGPARDIPPPLELLCLKALWSLQEGNVKDVQQTLAASRTLAYTTVMTLLDRLVRKGTVVRRKVGRAFLYAPTTTRDSMRCLALKEFLDLYFDGSQDDLLDFLSRREPEPPQPSLRTETRLDAALL